MVIRKVTEQYYSKWLGEDNIISRSSDGIYFLYSPERNITQYGYNSRFDLFVFFQQERIIVSYGDNAADKIQELKRALPASPDINTLKKTIHEIYHCSTSHNIKYIFTGTTEEPLYARSLSSKDYDLYLDFFKKINPNCSNIDWVKDYFKEMTTNGLCCGVYDNGILVSCTDAPGMPYMSDMVQEIGINTLDEYRGKGLAAVACTTCIKEIIKRGKCPLWSTKIDNIASQRLAAKIGFVKYADVLTLTL